MEGRRSPRQECSVWPLFSLTSCQWPPVLSQDTAFFPLDKEAMSAVDVEIGGSELCSFPNFMQRSPIQSLEDTPQFLPWDRKHGFQFFLGLLPLWNPPLLLSPLTPCSPAPQCSHTTLRLSKIALSAQHWHLHWCSHYFLLQKGPVLHASLRVVWIVWLDASRVIHSYQDLNNRLRVPWRWGTCIFQEVIATSSFTTWFLRGWITWRSCCGVWSFTAGFKHAMETDADGADA